MTPAEIKSIITILEIVAKMGAWPLAGVFAAVVGPWIVGLLALWWIDRRHEHRMQESRDHYNNNVELVREVVSVAQSLRNLVEDNQGAMVRHTEALIALSEGIRTNQYCPLIRTEKKTVEVGL